MKIRTPGLGNDLNAASAGARVLGGVRIIINLDFLNRRRRYTCSIRLHPVNDDRHSARRDRAGIEESRHGTDIVLVEDRQIVHRLSRQRCVIAVIGCLGTQFRRVGAYIDF